MKKFLSVSLALAMMLGLGLNAFADSAVNGSSGEGTTTLTLTAEATQLSATVPTSLAISVNATTDATVGVGHITNNSNGILEVKSITLSNGTYALESYTTKPEFMRYNVGSRKLGLSIAFGGGVDDNETPADSDDDVHELTGSAVTYITGADFTTATAKNLSAGTLKIAALNNGAYLNTLKIVPSALVSPTGSTAISVAEDAATMVIVLGWYTGS